jgi:nucleotide-binding universal stress UspA family protein
MAAMAYQDILVHVRPYGSIEPVEVALRLGGRFDARVTGLYALEDVARFRQILAESSAPLRGLIERDHAAAAQAEQRVCALAEREGVDFDWQTLEGETADLIAIVSRL